MSRDATGFVGVVAVVRYLVWGVVGCGFVWGVVGVVCGGCACPGPADVPAGAAIPPPISPPMPPLHCLPPPHETTEHPGGGGFFRWVLVGGFGPRNVGVAGAGPLLLALGAGLVGVWVFRWCPTLPLPGGGSTIGAGGLSFRVRYGSGRFPAPLWPPGRWWGVVRVLGWGSPPGGGVGGLVLGCVVDAVGSSGVRVAFLSAPSSCSRGRPGVGVVPACCGGGCVWGVFVLAD